MSEGYELIKAASEFVTLRDELNALVRKYGGFSAERRTTLDKLREWRDEEPTRRGISDRDLQELLNKLHP